MRFSSPRSRRATELTLVALAWGCGWGSARAGQDFELHTISSRADTVSGGRVLVQLEASTDFKWTAQLDGRDVTSSFHLARGSGHLLALLTGLKERENTLEIRVNGKVRSRLEILNHPLAGPVFSGPHQQPFICETEANGLGPATGADCDAKTLVQYYYKSTQPARDALKKSMQAAVDPVPGSLAPGFKPYDTSAPPPSDIAKTVTSDGQTVNYIVRRETGVINRAVYEIQFLHEPGQPLPTPWTFPSPGWNRRLAYDFGGGCGGVGYHQGKLIYSGNNQQPVLAQGYAVATSTLNDFINTCNDRVASETLSMVKEHFIKQFGVPVHTIGFGPSAAAMQQHLIAQNYPGLLDGIIVKSSFPDMVTVSQDCALLDHAFRSSQQPWTEAQKTAVSGFATWRTCKDWDGPDPQNCDTSLPKEIVYDRSANPNGARCDFYDDEINVFGRDPRTGFARRPLDNVGVQYGLVALGARKITAEQFVALNETIGGYDQDLRIVSSRMQAASDALDDAYSRGLVATGGGGLGEIPIIDWRSYLDDLANLHDRFRSFVMRARLIAANGDADNQVILVDPRIDFFTWVGDPDPATSLIARREGELVRGMDRWLDNVAADSAPGTRREKVVRGKPADLADGCWATDGERIVEPATYDGPSRCNQLYPSHADPRIAAGGPLAGDLLKCALKPLNPADYPQTLSGDQLQRLRAVFPGGVCDYSRPGVGQQITKTTWQKY